MELTTVWFALIAILWAGYFLLEGFDFGVGVLLPVLGRDDVSRRLMINTIGPVWDGNEVWLLVAGGATFAAFPEWYATLFSGFYLPLLLILVALILRGVAFEYRGKKDDARWRSRWDACIIGGSLVPALLWGVAFGNIVRGVKLDANHEYVGGFFDLLNPYALLGGLTTLTLFTLHGAVFLALKTDGDLRLRAGGWRRRWPGRSSRSPAASCSGPLSRITTRSVGRCRRQPRSPSSARSSPSSRAGRAGRSWPPRCPSCSPRSRCS
jgi:cytochrome d ubiquinol oxidase subunit II